MTTPFAWTTRATTLIAVAALAGCVAAPSADIDFMAADLPPRVELEHVPFHPQTQYQCGPAALATALNASGVQASPEQLSPEIYLPGKKGSLQVELIAAARARDRVVYPLADLSGVLAQVSAGHPVLVLQNLGWRFAPAWHFAVIVGYDRDARELILRSGNQHRLTMDTQRFLRTWERAERWAVVVLKPEHLPAQAELRSYMASAAALEATGRLEAAGAAYERRMRSGPTPSGRCWVWRTSVMRAEMHRARSDATNRPSHSIPTMRSRITTSQSCSMHAAAPRRRVCTSPAQSSSRRRRRLNLQFSLPRSALSSATDKATARRVPRRTVFRSRDDFS